MVKSFSAGVSHPRLFSGPSGRSWQAAKYSAERDTPHPELLTTIRDRDLVRRELLPHLRIPAARITPELLQETTLENKRAQGKPGARCTRSLARKQKSARASSPQVHRNSPAFPARWF